MIRKDLLFSDDCPQPEISTINTGKSVIYGNIQLTPFEFFNNAVLRDEIRNGELQLRLSTSLPKPTYYVKFSSPIPGHSWISKDMDFETAISTYSAVIHEEFI